MSVPDLSTLLSAIETADRNRMIPPFLAQELNDTKASLTIFAPINSAFQALNSIIPGYLAMLLTPAFGLQLTDILSYHVTQGRVTTNRFPITNLQMLAAGTVNTTAANGAFQVNSFSSVPAKLLPPVDVSATNGVAQVVDNVLVPQFVGENIITALRRKSAAENNRFSKFLNLLMLSGLDTVLANTTGVTLLAPTNAAISTLTEQFLSQPANADVLRSVVKYNVISEMFNYAAQSVPNILLKKTLEGENIVVGLVITMNNSVTVSYNQATQQGFFLSRANIGYVIDRLLIPPTLTTVVPT